MTLARIGMTGRTIFDVLDAFLAMFGQQRALFVLMAAETTVLLEVVVDVAKLAGFVVLVIEFEILVVIEICRTPLGIAVALPTGAIDLLV